MAFNQTKIKFEPREESALKPRLKLKGACKELI